ncbi:MAG TPA: translocation/assembly module TamB domain-containing protein, partial [Microvirga sp.]|nr:translocation/assembly module TamB domain-containing protein [Microvirga sp.]
RAALDPAGLAEGSLTVKAPDLDSLSPLLLTRLGGSLDAALTLARADGRQDARLVATGRSLRVPAVELAGLDADLSAADLYGRLSLNGRLEADRLVAGGETFESVRLAATGSAAASDVTLAARARGFALEGAARVLPQDRATRVEVASLSAQRSGRRIALVQPASVTLEGGTATIAGLVVAAETGRITLSGQVGERLALDLGVRALPLSAIDILRPGLGLSGTLDGEATLSGSTAAPRGPFRLTLARGAAPATRSAGLAPIDATLRGELAGESATIEGDLRAGAPVQLRATGRVPLDPAGPLSVAVTGRADAAVANAALGTTGQRLTGRIAVDGRVTGTLGAPRLEGSATLAEGTFTDPIQGIRLTGLRGRVSGSGDTLTVDELSAATRNGGTLAVRGRVEIAPDSGWPGQLRIQASRAELLSSDVMTLVTDLNLDLSGPLARTPRVAGRVGIVTLDVSIPDQLPVNIKPLPGARHIAPPPAVRARLAAQAKAQAERRRAGPPFNATLDLAIAAPNRIFVRGRGVDAELGGDLRLTGTSRDPVAIGTFDLRRGRITLIGQQIDFTRGRLTFAGDLTPDLDLVAETSAGDVTARIGVSGPADRPAFDLSSEPSLPQDEVLSRLLFQKASGNLSGFQALQLAQAVSQLSGGAAGIDVFDRARRSLGLDSLDLTTGSGGGVAVGASRYISDRVSVGVRAGANPEDSAATVNIDVTRRLRVQGEAGADGRTSIGVGAEWEY